MLALRTQAIEVWLAREARLERAQGTCSLLPRSSPPNSRRTDSPSSQSQMLGIGSIDCLAMETTDE
jgi:hypothetical protein